MTREPNDDTDSSLSRRTFMKAAGVTAGAAAPGVGASGSAAAAGELDSRLLNWRRVEAKKVWDRGYRG
jgi:nitrous oxide reductase